MNQSSLVLELQQLASNSTNDICDVLRQALMVAVKLNLSELKKWIEYELNGYPEDMPVPKYRIVRANMYGKDTDTGRLVPTVFPPEVAEILLNVSCREPLAAFAAIQGKSNGFLEKPLSPEVSRMITQQDQAEWEFFEPKRYIPNTTPECIIDAVRSSLLKWALQLEEEGILGEGMTFTLEEKGKASGSQQIYIRNFQGIFGDVSNSCVEQRLQMDIKKNDFESLAVYLRSLKMSDAEIEELKNAIEEDGPITETDTFGSKVTGWLGGIMVKAGKLTGPLATAVSSGLLVEAIKAYYGM